MPQIQEFHQIILIITFVINLILLVLLLQRRERTTLIFAIAVIGLLIWTACVFLYPLFENPKILYVIGVVAYWGPITTSASILLFSFLFPKSTKALAFYHKVIIMGGAILAIIITLIPGFVLKGVTTEGYKLITGTGLYLLFFIIGFFLVWGLINLIRKYFTLSGIYRLQLKYLFIGIFLTFIIGFTSNAILAALGIYEYIWLGPIVTVIFVIFTTYAITRHHLFEIRVILTEFLVGLTGLILLVQALIAETLWWKILGFILLFLFGISGYFLIQSVLKEIALRAELQKAYVELERLDKAKSEFISIASHQLRTPLTAIKGYISMILEGTYGNLSKKVGRPMENVFKSNERLIKLINDILDVSRIETGRMEINFEMLSLEEIITNVVEELKIEAKKKNIYLNWKKPESPLPKTLVDRDKIRQVVLNIVDNAIRYTNKGGVKIELKTLDEKAQIRVSDTGVGIRKEELSKMFKSFSRGMAGTRLYTEGVGLGLYVARKFVEMHGGRIWAESKGESEGSTFYVELPLSR